MGLKIDLIGQRFVQLVVIRETDKRNSSGSIIWECKCDCGNTHFAATNMLRYGEIRSCNHENTIDITGFRSGKLVAIKATEKRNKYKNVMWECKCDCGNTCLVPATRIKSEKQKSCGCARKAHLYLGALDLKGERFGRLIAVEPLKERKGNQVVWECRCDCGNTHTVVATLLKSGGVKSCGCLSHEISASAPAIVENTHLYKLINPKLSAINTSGVTGVRMVRDKWEARMRFQGKLVLCKLFDTKYEAINARKKAEDTYHKPFVTKYQNKLKDKCHLQM